jgi:hypothetical protein
MTYNDYIIAEKNHFHRIKIVCCTSVIRTCTDTTEAASDASLIACMVLELVWNAMVARSKVLSRFCDREGREGEIGG